MWIYAGGPRGYSAQRRIELPAVGPHFFSFGDIGNIYDRSDRYEYISPAHDAGKEVRWQELRWEGETPFRTKLWFQVRTAQTREGLEQSPWQGPAEKSSFFERSPSGLSMRERGRWIQYKAVLISPNRANSPILKKVAIDYSMR